MPAALLIADAAAVIPAGINAVVLKPDYATVLGLALENGETSPDLLARPDTAREYLTRYPETRLVLSGVCTGHSTRFLLAPSAAGVQIPAGA